MTDNGEEPYRKIGEKKASDTVKSDD